MKDYVEYNPLSPKSKIQLTEKWVESLLKLLRKENAGVFQDPWLSQWKEEVQKIPTVKHKFYRVWLLMERYNVNMGAITSVINSSPDLFVFGKYENYKRVLYVKDGRLEDFFLALWEASESTKERIVQLLNRSNQQ